MPLFQIYRSVSRWMNFLKICQYLAKLRASIYTCSVSVFLHHPVLINVFHSGLQSFPQIWAIVFRPRLISTKHLTKIINNLWVIQLYTKQWTIKQIHATFLMEVVECVRFSWTAKKTKDKSCLRPMSHLRFYRAILSRNFIARQNRKCDMACRATSQQSHNSFSY